MKRFFTFCFNIWVWFALWLVPNTATETKKDASKEAAKEAPKGEAAKDEPVKMFAQWRNV